MVCPRCIEAVKGILNQAEIDFHSVELGKVTLSGELKGEKINQLEEKLKLQGFELLQSDKAALISRIKTLIINQIHHSSETLTTNYSTFLSEKLNHEYSYLSRLFSGVEGITIEKFITRQKIERVKELLIYDEFSLSEIAFKLDYSSVAYLSSQFKKETGMTPSDFKKSTDSPRKSLDKV